MTTASTHLRRTSLPTRAAVTAGAQVGVGLLAWALFVAGWARVLTNGLSPAGALRDFALLAGLFLVISGTTALWIRHNRAIYRRKGPRRAPTPGPGYPARDRLGRRMLADVDAARQAGDIVVVVGARTKRYDLC